LRERHGSAFRDELRQRALAEIERVDGMVLSPDARVPPREADVAFEIVQDEAGRRAAMETAAGGFEVAAELFERQYTAPLLALPGVTTVIVRAGDEPVSTATAFVQGEAVGIFGVATPPSARGRGFASLATWRACEIGFASGATFAYLQSSAMGNPVYRRLGFRTVDTYTYFGAAAS
jgi:predicted GNAT family acetyltransferase